jgi:hypothetical protein
MTRRGARQLRKRSRRPTYLLPLLFFRFRDGDGTLLSFHKRLFRHIDLNNKKALRNAA